MYGQWSCNQTDCKATCEVMGHGLVKTFDGETINIFSDSPHCAFRLVTFEATVSSMSISLWLELFKTQLLTLPYLSSPTFFVRFGLAFVYSFAIVVCLFVVICACVEGKARFGLLLICIAHPPPPPPLPSSFSSHFYLFAINQVMLSLHFNLIMKPH